MRITSVYVTHDQAEAMVTSDRIAVMHEGRLEQIGTPEEIYEHPRTQFVAGFIGRTNGLTGVVAGDDCVECDGLTLRFAPNGSTFERGGMVSVSIRPQSIGIQPADGLGQPTSPAPRRGAGANVVRGRVVRHVYLGEARDYLVALAGNALTLRVSTSATQAFKLGEAVDLTIEADACRVIPA